MEEELTVHAPVRSPDNPKKLQYLNAIAEQTSSQIKYFKADLLDPGSYAEAMAGCELVYHTASPFSISVNDPQKELVDPAKLGTRNVLETANAIPSVKRVVRNIDVPWVADNSRGIRELGISDRSLAESMNDFFQPMIDSGLVTKN